MALENCHFDYEVSSIALLDAMEPFSLVLSCFLEHTDPIYKVYGTKGTWETCH